MREKLLEMYARNHRIFVKSRDHLDRDYEIHNNLLKEADKNGWTIRYKITHKILISCERVHLWVMENCLIRNHDLLKQLKSLD